MQPQSLSGSQLTVWSKWRGQVARPLFRTMSVVKQTLQEFSVVGDASLI